MDTFYNRLFTTIASVCRAAQTIGLYAEVHERFLRGISTSQEIFVSCNVAIENRIAIAGRDIRI